MISKSKECPEYDGTNALSVEILFFTWRENKMWKAVLDKIRHNNIEYWTVKQVQSLSDLLDARGEKSTLGAFIALWYEWTGEMPVKGKGKRKISTGRRSISLDCGNGKKVNIKVQYARSHPTADDRKNGAFYLDRQLIGIHIK